jgi:aldose 1-epimerase
MAAEPAAVLRSASGFEVHLLATGAVVQRLLAPDRAGVLADVVLGFDSVEPYKDGTSPYFGAVVGRVANRIAGAAFTLDGRAHALAANNGPNCLHGGVRGFSRVEWRLAERGGGGPDGASEHARFEYRSADGEEGFPGALEAAVTYSLDAAGALRVEFSATADAPTLVNLAQHSYFNLAGAASGEDVLGHELQLHAERFLPVDDVQIPTGEAVPVAGTPMDFRAPARVGARIAEVGGPGPGGYDHCYCLRGAADAAPAEPVPAATLRHAASGRRLDVSTTAPGVQLYTGNFLDGSLVGKGGARYGLRAGLCLETQSWPDAVHSPAFPSAVLRPGERYHHVAVYAFSVE